MYIPPFIATIKTKISIPAYNNVEYQKDSHGR